jgi:uncharacterized membrane protein
MPPSVAELLHLLVRWVHLIAGIMWIGNSMLFNWLDRNLEPAGPDKPRSLGTMWMVHSGGFYLVEKTHLAPGELPKTLHWFKWQNGITWLSGIALLVLVYYMGGAAIMTEGGPGALAERWAVLLGIGTVVASWLVYDLVWRSPLGKNPALAIALSVLDVLALAAVQFHFLGGRAAYIHVGVMLGTIMTGNVWFVILPSQRELIAATKEGRAQDPRIGYQAKQRSVHNNYITFPLLFIMLSNHFPIAYGNRWSWVVLLVLAVSSALVRHFMNIRFHYAAWSVDVAMVVGAGCAATLFLFAFPRGWAAERAAARANVKLSYADVEPILKERCVPCHSSRPTSAVFHTAPNGVLLETPDEVRALLPRVKLRAVTLQNMPLGNATQMTDDERATLASWIEQQERGT